MESSELYSPDCILSDTEELAKESRHYIQEIKVLYLLTKAKRGVGRQCPCNETKQNKKFPTRESVGISIQKSRVRNREFLHLAAPNTIWNAARFGTGVT